MRVHLIVERQHSNVYPVPRCKAQILGVLSLRGVTGTSPTIFMLLPRPPPVVESNDCQRNPKDPSQNIMCYFSRYDDPNSMRAETTKPVNNPWGTMTINHRVGSPREKKTVHKLTAYYGQRPDLDSGDSSWHDLHRVLQQPFFSPITACLVHTLVER